jgi:hypothetical protein
MKKENIFQINHAVENSDKFYTLLGLESFVDDLGFPRLNENDDNIFAKVIYNKPRKNINNNQQHPRFYIKTDPQKNIHNPIKLFSSPNHNTKSMPYINKVCKDPLKFTEVTESVFTKYINFLKTKNITWLTNAQRDII